MPPAANQRGLPRKLTVRVNGRKQVFARGAGESERHILLKALVFALYLTQYPALSVERGIGNRYKPDLIALASDSTPIFWAECGQIGTEKLTRLVRRFPDTHLVVAKMAVDLSPWQAIIERALPERRTAPIDLLGFDATAWDALAERGDLDLSGVTVHRRVFPASDASARSHSREPSPAGG